MNNASLFPLLFSILLFHLDHLNVAVREPFTFRASDVVASTATTLCDDDCSYIRKSCINSTLYPDVCVNSLLPYAGEINSQPAELARYAVNVSLSKANALSYNLSKLTSEPYNNDGALGDCRSVLHDAVDQIKDSLNQMIHFNGTGWSLRFQISNVQTWMSAALTDEDTCTDELLNVVEGSTVNITAIRDQINEVMEVTSNALALFDKSVG